MSILAVLALLTPKPPYQASPATPDKRTADTGLAHRLQGASPCPIAPPAAPQSRSLFYISDPSSLLVQMQKQKETILTQAAKNIYCENNRLLARILNALCRCGLRPLSADMLQQNLPAMLTEKSRKGTGASEEWSGMLRRIPTLLQGLSQSCTTLAPAYAERVRQQMEQHNACFLQNDQQETCRQILNSDQYAEQVATGLNRLYLEIGQSLPNMLVVDDEIQNRDAIWAALLASETNVTPAAQPTADHRRAREDREKQDADGPSEVRLRSQPVEVASTKRQAWRESAPQTQDPTLPEHYPQWNKR